MELIRLEIPSSFIKERVALSWTEVCFGLENELLDPSAPVDLAVAQAIELETPPSALVELAGASRGDPVLDLVKLLAGREPRPPDNTIRDKWLYLTLAWIYEHRDEYSDPLQAVENVYADFDYPSQIAGFVRYMPMKGADLGSKAANERRLYDRWEEFLEEYNTSYSA